MEKQSSWTTYLLSVTLVAALGVVVGIMPARESSSVQQSESLDLPKTTIIKTVSYQGKDGSTALKLLDAAHDIAVETSDVGAYVTKIDGVGGEPNAFWLYYVNGQSAAIAADRYQTQSGDYIEWRYERF